MCYWIARIQHRGPVGTNQSFAAGCIDWSKNFRGDLLDRALLWNQAHLRQALRECVSTSGATTSTEPTDRSLARHPCGVCLSLSNPLRSNASLKVDMIFSAESPTSIAMRLDLHGRSFRHAQGCCASTSRKARTSPAGPPRTSKPSLSRSTTDPERASTGRLQPRSSSNSYARSNNPVLQRPVELKQYTSVKFTESLALQGLSASIGSVGDAYDNALAESIIG